MFIMSYSVRDVIKTPQLTGTLPSEQDQLHLKALRNFVSNFIEQNAIKY